MRSPGADASPAAAACLDTRRYIIIFLSKPCRPAAPGRLAGRRAGERPPRAPCDAARTVRAPPRVRLFVDGTLRRGGANHARLRGATYLGPAETEARFALYDRGPYPALVAAGGNAIEGEVYAIGRPLLARLDRFEGHPTLYRRVTLSLRGAGPAEGYVWAGALPAGARFVAGGH